MLLERVKRLIAQRNPIYEEEYALGPTRTLQHINQRDGGSCLSCTGRHDHEKLPTFLLQLLEDGPNSLDLVVTPSDIAVDQLNRKRLALLAA